MLVGAVVNHANMAIEWCVVRLFLEQEKLGSKPADSIIVLPL